MQNLPRFSDFYRDFFLSISVMQQLFWKLIGSDFIVKPRVAQICHANIAYQIHGNRVGPISKTNRGLLWLQCKVFQKFVM